MVQARNSFFYDTKAFLRMYRKHRISLAALLLLAFVSVFWGFTCSVQEPADAVSQQPLASPQYPVLAELFTSQGCSSCPPADRVLEQLAAQDDLQVIVLSYHVDYWNRLGWRDPYSQAAFSERQRQYARHLNDRGVYTPQLVINGRSGHVGSREREITTAIEQAGSQAPAVEITGQAHWLPDQQQIQLKYQLSTLPEQHQLQIALVEKEVENDVPQGENRGRHLRHTNVVRTLLSTEPTQTNDTFSFPLPKDFDTTDDLSVVVFMQHPVNMSISGAKQLSLIRP